MVTSFSKFCDLTLCKKCSVSLQELTSFLMWFLWLLLGQLFFYFLFSFSHLLVIVYSFLFPPVFR